MMQASQQLIKKYPNQCMFSDFNFEPLKTTYLSLELESQTYSAKSHSRGRFKSGEMKEKVALREASDLKYLTPYFLLRKIHRTKQVS